MIELSTGADISGQRAVWMEVVSPRKWRQTCSAKCGAIGVMSSAWVRIHLSTSSTCMPMSDVASRYRSRAVCSS